PLNIWKCPLTNPITQTIVISTMSQTLKQDVTLSLRMKHHGIQFKKSPCALCNILFYPLSIQ
ncbi:unnamed protein product, partial [Gadus morhua 'NCC']